MRPEGGSNHSNETSHHVPLRVCCIRRPPPRRATAVRATMLPACALLLVLGLALRSAKAAEPTEAFCAMIDVDSSSIYETNGAKHFSYKFIVPQWVPNMRVHLSFTEPVANLVVNQGATVVDQYYYYGNTDDTLVIVQLDDAPHSATSNEFLVIGTGTNEMNMGISCTGNGVPPPSPPHPSDCTLGPQYHVRNTWSNGEEAELYFNTWVENQFVRLRYWGEHIDVKLTGGSATLATLTFEDGVTTATLQLGPASGDTVVKLQLSQPAYHKPMILCHEAWLPPPPPPPPVSPPSAPPIPYPPPPLPLASIEASYECALGGVARVQSTRMLDTQTRWLHVVVQPDTWTIGYVVLVRVLGSGIVVDGVTHASLEGGDGRAGPNLFAFVLQHPRAGAHAASFGFNLQGREAKIASMTCRVGSPSPPQQAAAPAYTYSYDELDEALDAPKTNPGSSNESSDTLDDLLTAVLVLVVLATGGCAAYQSRHTIELRLDRLAATSSWARTIRNLMPAGASEAELSVFDDGAQDGELNDAARRAARRGRRGSSTTTRINPVDDHDKDEDEDEDTDDEPPQDYPEPEPSRRAKDAAAAKKRDADDDVFSTALVLRQGEMRELD